jgi:hypothetical protein
MSGSPAGLLGDHQDLPETLDDAAVADDAVDLGDHRRLPRLAGLEQLDDARQTAGDVLGLGGLARDLGEHGSREQGLAVAHHQMRVRRHVVAVDHLPA